MSEKNPSFIQILNTAIDLRLAKTFVALPGKIEKFDAESQLADVKPLIHYKHTFSDGREEYFPLPVIYRVPVIFEGTDRFFMTYPIHPGDRCEIRFHDRRLDSWAVAGDDTVPPDSRQHDILDAVAVMGLRDQSRKIPEFDTVRPMMGVKEGPKIAFASGQIEIGNSWDEFLTTAAARADKVDDRLTKIQEKLDTLITLVQNHEHPVAGAVAGKSISLNAATTLGALESTAAERVKIR